MLKVSDGWAQVLEEVRAVMLAWCGKSSKPMKTPCWRRLLPAIQAAANPPPCGAEPVWKCRFSLAESRPFSEPCCSWSSVGVSREDMRCENTKKSGSVPNAADSRARSAMRQSNCPAGTWHISASECERLTVGMGRAPEHRISNTMGRIWEWVFLVPWRCKRSERKGACVRLNDFPVQYVQ